ncbi:hypothetical protein EGW08_015949 [Elysia chlorotica]|uniref:Peptidase M13 N-terminal domain-containing protein n=1 Tax=Elysia chlorotica TaxID=188477 RepID=A0A433T3Y6_ELYCH|nr:hypothetical protein EGW08_015949 [Elysia chlorotica]
MQMCHSVFREVAALLAILDLSPDLTLPLSFDLLLRRAQDKFGVNPFLTIQRKSQFDGTVYRYVTRASVPYLSFADEEYSLKMQDSQAAMIYIDSLTYIIRRVLEVEAADTPVRGRRRRRDADGGLGTNRRKRQTIAVTEDNIRDRVTEALLLEWEVATLVREELAKETNYLVRQLPVRTLQNLTPQLPWVILTDLRVIDTIQVSGMDYLQAVQTLLVDSDPAVVKMLVYVQCVVSLLPYMPATVRSELEAAGTGIQKVYSAESCSRLTLTVAFEESMSGLERWSPLGFPSDTQLALDIAARATSRLQNTFGIYNAANQETKQNILSDLSNLRFIGKSFTTDSGRRHSIVSLSSLPETSASLVTVAQTVLNHKRAEAASEAFTADAKSEGTSLWVLDFSPLVNAAEGIVVLPPGFVLLARWTRDAQFFQEFLMSIVYRALIDFVMNRDASAISAMCLMNDLHLSRSCASERKHLFSASYLETHSCSLRSFRNVYIDEEETSDSVREMQLSVLTEIAVQGLIFRFYDGIPSGSSPVMSRIVPLKNVMYILDQTMRKDYRSSNWFYRCQGPSCFFWAQGDSLAGEGTR